ncbi:ferredoxin [Actinokineospora iranica]|uniref:Ferredoxin n=1 Tax=Actinokineospora iranica TaxID=1271860 RepID=A0A1G6RWH7_9PSEU|nr:ferredoxin [Actinokineospora iranica]SDD08783.1 ferredoxin [Actinokineospora iranica]
MSWTVRVDATACMGSGVCAGSRPDVFRLAGRHSEAVRAAVPPDDAVLDVADTCPASAITVTDETGAEIGPRP